MSDWKQKLKEAFKGTIYESHGFDRTFCDSENCQNKCGRQMSQKHKDILAAEPFKRRISYAYFCDEKGEVIE